MTSSNTMEDKTMMSKMNSQLQPNSSSDISEDTNLLTMKPPGCWARAFPSGFYQELKGIYVLAWPMVLTQLFQMCQGPLSVIFCGHLGKVELDAVALANSVINIAGITVAIGLISASDTLFSQIYGSSQRHRLGIALQRSLLILMLASIPCIVIFLNAAPLLITIGQNPQVVQLTAQYMLIMIPGMFAFFVYISLARYIQNQNIVFPGVIIGFLATIVNGGLHYVFIYVLNMGIKGSAYAQSMCYVSMLTLTILYIYCSGVYQHTWQGWAIDCLQDWGLFFKLAIFGLVTLAVEWWSFEIGIFLAGILGETELGAQSIIFQMELISYVVPQGVGIATSIKVGQKLGAGDGQAAKTAARVGMVICGLMGTLVSILYITLRDYLPLIFTNVPEVVELGSEILPICGAYSILGFLNTECTAILRGCGRQYIGAVVASVFYMIALSIGIPIMFTTSLGIKGFWIALVGCCSVTSIIYLTVINLSNWDKQARLAQERVKANEAIMAILEGNKVSTDESTALLEKRRPSTQSNQWQSEYKDNLSHDSQVDHQRRKRYSSRVSQPFPPAVPLQHTMPRNKMIRRRALTFVFFMLVLVAGIIGHFLYQYNMTDQTGQFPLGNSTTPLWNGTLITVMPNRTHIGASAKWLSLITN